MRNATLQLTATIETLTKTVDGRLEQIGGKVSERLDEGFKKTNETFASVMARLATIDEAQKKIDGLTSNVVSLQELLGDKRSRGAFGEVQLEALVRNILPAQAFAMQHSFPNGTRVDCALFLPEPTGTVGVDSSFRWRITTRCTRSVWRKRIACRRKAIQAMCKARRRYRRQVHIIRTSLPMAR